VEHSQVIYYNADFTNWIIAFGTSYLLN